MKFALFYRSDKNELVGIDSYFPLDGRWSTNTCINKINEYVADNPFVRSKATYFTIHTGTLLHSNKICNNYFKLNV